MTAARTALREEVERLLAVELGSAEYQRLSRRWLIDEQAMTWLPAAKLALTRMSALLDAPAGTRPTDVCARCGYSVEQSGVVVCDACYEHLSI